MTEKYAKKLLLEDLEYKKSFDANYETECDICSDTIEQDEEFVFIGNKNKLCPNCLEELKGFLENEQL